jgi:hypothetical protein
MEDLMHSRVYWDKKAGEYEEELIKARASLAERTKDWNKVLAEVAKVLPSEFSKFRLRVDWAILWRINIGFGGKARLIKNKFGQLLNQSGSLSLMSYAGDVDSKCHVISVPRMNPATIGTEFYPLRYSGHDPISTVACLR